jgi:hypothetical protein
MKDEVTRKDVIALASNVLVNLGIIHAAALAASFTGIEQLEKIPINTFAIGLIASIFAQLLWYIDIELEFTFKDEVFETALGSGPINFRIHEQRQM